MLRISGILVLVSLVYACSGVNKATVKIDGTATGVITFTKTEDGITLEGEIKGLSPGKHGFHVHSLGDISKGCDSTGTHFNPYGKNHGAPNATERHVGDLGNIEADESGVAKVQITDKIISFQGVTNIIGRSIVIHSGVDDLGLGGHPDSLKSGNSGSRIACGVIGILEETSKGGRISPAISGLFTIILSAVLLSSNKIFM